jgi:eukaryotic-like serine/threonine-protein kinase
MNGAGVFLVALLTSVATAAGTVYAIERYDLLPRRQVAAAAPVQVTVPNFTGLAEADARANAAAAKIALLISGREPSVDAKAGSVIRQSIPAGQKIPESHPLSVVIADELPKVPTVAGMTLSAAKQKLEQLGYQVKEGDGIASATVPAGSVLAQSPEAETPALKGSPVTLQLSTGPGEVDVPKLIGVNVTKAQKEIEKLGLKPMVRWVELAETPTMVVLSQKPAAGQKLKPGAEVQVTVCR